MEKSSMSVGLGERIWRVRTRLRKTQREFAQILGSQQNSVSRYEKDKVVPGVAVLAKLHDLAEPDEKQAFAEEIRKQIGSGISKGLGLQEEISFAGTIDELRPMIEVIAESQKLESLATAGRKDKAALLWVTSTLAEDSRIDEALIDILIQCVQCRKQKGAPAAFRETAEFLRARLAEKTADQGNKTKR